MAGKIYAQTEIMISADGITSQYYLNGQSQ